MPTPEELGPLGAHLVDGAFSWCSGRVIFAGGSEISLVDEPRLLEAVRTDGATSLAHVLDAVTARALVPAESQQATSGGSNARFATVFEEPGVSDTAEPAPRTWAIVTDRLEVGAALTAAVAHRGVTCGTIDVAGVTGGFVGIAEALAGTAAEIGPLDAVVLALAASPAHLDGSSDWQRILEEHRGIVTNLHADAAWARAVSDYAAITDRVVRLLTLTDATTAGGCSRAQAAAQHARSARGATDDRVVAFSVSVETPWSDEQPVLVELAAHLLCSDDAPALSGAELVVGGGWFGLRSHPRPTGSISYGGPELPDWFDATLRRIIGEEER